MAARFFGEDVLFHSFVSIEEDIEAKVEVLG
jgi:hypothetical protein